MEQVFAITLKPRRAIRHDAFPLGGADLPTQVRLAGLAELALFALGIAILGQDSQATRHRQKDVLKCNHIISWLDGRHALPD
jgi:hypothetical protein